MSVDDDDEHESAKMISKAELRELRHEPAQSFMMRHIKGISLGLLVLQNSAQFLAGGYSRRANADGSPLYLVSVAVLLAEVGKCLLCCVVIIATEGGVEGWLEEMRRDVLGKPLETLKVGVPAFCYTLQNNLLYVALSNLPPAVCQVLYQTKTLSTAFWSIMLLGKVIGGPQWASLVLLVAGVVLVQWKDSASNSLGADANPMIGLSAVAACSLLSGFAGVFLERMLKGTQTSLWVRNIQLCLFSVPLQLLAIAQQDSAAVSARGLLGGFNQAAWLVVLINTGGGLLVAVVIKVRALRRRRPRAPRRAPEPRQPTHDGPVAARLVVVASLSRTSARAQYADNILKTFATVLAIVCSCFVSMSIPSFDFRPSLVFFCGVATVFASIFLYAWTPSRPLLSYLRRDFLAV